LKTPFAFYLCFQPLAHKRGFAEACGRGDHGQPALQAEVELGE